LVVQFACGVILQVVGTLGLSWFCQKTLTKVFGFQLKISCAFGLAFLLESTGLGLLSFVGLLKPTLLQGWMILKVGLGLYVGLTQARLLFQHLRNNLSLSLVTLAFLFNACLPTSNFDCFSAHLAIPKLFLEAQGYPLRPDFQYLEALPLGAHMWYLPGLSLGLEGSCNALAPLFAFFIFFLMRQTFGGRCAWWSLCVALSMPEFLRVSLDPMVDTPCFFYILAGFLCLRSRKLELQWLGLGFWCFLFALKPTLAPCALVGTCWMLWRVRQQLLTPRGIQYSFILLGLGIMGCLWSLKNAVLYGNILHPYWGAAHMGPYIPMDWRPNLDYALNIKIWNYLKVLFADYHYNLSLGFWPLFSLPLVWKIKTSSQRWVLGLFILGLALTFALTPFKNRYAMPYFFLALPSMALLAQNSSRGMKGLLILTVCFNLASAAPYIGQPLWVAYKQWNQDDYYRFKFYNYAAYEAANRCPEGKILLIGQPSTWIQRPHLLAVISETHLDFTRLEQLETFIKYLHTNQISFVVFDRSDAQGMANNSDPWYRGKSWCALKALEWVDALKAHASTQVIHQEAGVEILDVREL
jgi:hypothetical protein